VTHSTVLSSVPAARSHETARLLLSLSVALTNETSCSSFFNPGRWTTSNSPFNLEWMYEDGYGTTPQFARTRRIKSSEQFIRAGDTQAGLNEYPASSSAVQYRFSNLLQWSYASLLSHCTSWHDAWSVCIRRNRPTAETGRIAVVVCCVSRCAWRLRDEQALRPCVATFSEARLFHPRTCHQFSEFKDVRG
jgi:hypothetical protein